jgi:hypothetical protein
MPTCRGSVKTVFGDKEQQEMRSCRYPTMEILEEQI